MQGKIPEGAISSNTTVDLSQVLASSAGGIVDQISGLDAQAKLIGQAIAPLLVRHLTGQSIFDEAMRAIADGGKVEPIKPLASFDSGFIQTLQIQAVEATGAATAVFNDFQAAIRQLPPAAANSRLSLAGSDDGTEAD